MAEQKTKPKGKSTQKFLPIKEIREGIIILPDGSMRMVIHTSAVNFELKSEQEKDSLVYSFGEFLNSLDFPIQIIIQSRRLELDDYLRKLSGRADTERNELVRLQILDYVEFVKRLITVANIMDKKFYIVVPYYPVGVKKGGLFGGGAKSTASAKEFEEGQTTLQRRSESVASGLSGLGIRCAQLKTEELVELYYNAYNPETALRQKLPSLGQVTSEIVEKLEEMEIG